MNRRKFTLNEQTFSAFIMGEARGEGKSTEGGRGTGERLLVVGVAGG